MAKIDELQELSPNLGNNATANNNFTKIEEALENTLSRDGSTPNEMEADIDLNGNDLLNANRIETTSLKVAGQSLISGSVALSWEGEWESGKDYYPYNLVGYDGSTYLVVVEHTSTSLEDDLLSEYLSLFAEKGEKGDTGISTGDLVSTNNLSELTDTDEALDNLGFSSLGKEVVESDEADILALMGLTGVVMSFATDAIPTGWLECDGSEVSRTTYSRLFTKIGVQFGSGDGSTTFNLPDLRGEFIRGWDNGRGVDSGRVFGTSQADEVGPHTHDVPVRSWSRNQDYGATGRRDPITGGSSSVATKSNGGTETRPRNVALMYCIKT